MDMTEVAELVQELRDARANRGPDDCPHCGGTRCDPDNVRIVTAFGDHAVAPDPCPLCGDEHLGE